ncbi:AzlD domain-containing protein [Natronospirillum operosum]|uniref:AzlD domain-containing protein n=1 Tax=Natronospirillum operosum TaxID=2759953 RepID=A0A4Z0WCE2_9GAMM|nr:AzlD domain-containing protein [Natronospirillum operosum]TGG95494.1 AzlD domain-containing protein [Natronospirillum operosum]
MTIALTTATGFLVIAVMGLVAYLTRIGGVLIMARMKIGRRTERFIYAMSGSALVAIVVPLAVEGDAAARASLVATSAVMLTTRKTLLAIAAGILVAAGWRALFVY